MTSSFVASLRKLAEDAAEAKRLEKAAAREAERSARAEAQRIKRQADARARQEVRKAKLRAAKEQREKAAEAKRIRRQDESAKRSEVKRTEAERRRAERVERERREEDERRRLREMRLAKICSDIYRVLAVAAWDGVDRVVVGDEALDFKSDLIEMGITVNRRNKLAGLASNALVELIETLDQFTSALESKYAIELFTRLRSMGARLQKTGQFILVSQISQLAARICSIFAREVEVKNRINSNLLSGVAEGEKSISEIEWKVREAKALLAAAKKRNAQISKDLAAVAKRIKSHIDDIGSSYRAHLPKRMEANELSFETKAAALRLAYGTYIRDIDFGAFSVLEIINLMRLANGRPLISALDSEAALAQRLECLKFDLASAKESLSSTRRKAKKTSADMDSASARLLKATTFQRCCIQFDGLFARASEGVVYGQLRFDGDRYVGPVIASLGAEEPVANAHLDAAYRELQWLVSEDGREFAGYLDIVLSELARAGARRVEAVFIANGSENRVEIGKVSLVCRIGSALMGLILSMRGISVDGMEESDGQTHYQLGW